MTRKIKFKPSEFLSVIPKLIEYINTLPDKLFDIEIKQHREKRSLDANALFWKGVGIIAGRLHIEETAVYLELLKDYGVYTHIIVKPTAVEQFKSQYRLCEDLGEVVVNGASGTQLKCYFGSSTYNTKQMSRLIDGMLNQIKDLEIDFVPESDISKAKSEWGS